MLWAARSGGFRFDRRLKVLKAANRPALYGRTRGGSFGRAAHNCIINENDRPNKLRRPVQITPARLILSGIRGTRARAHREYLKASSHRARTRIGALHYPIRHGYPVWIFVITREERFTSLIFGRKIVQPTTQLIISSLYDLIESRARPPIFFFISVSLSTS